MNVIELLADLQARHDEATTRAGELRGQIEHLTAALAETEAHPRSARCSSPAARTTYAAPTKSRPGIPNMLR
ncbi:hypothetical protein [Streptomyces sp. NPDC002133]|uniref:hypothetical protein n=1 Tax=Streptomyces sp. NPDC002133 TaxID=3154409 RepID=UPI003319FEDF